MEELTYGPAAGEAADRVEPAGRRFDAPAAERPGRAGAGEDAAAAGQSPAGMARAETAWLPARNPQGRRPGPVGALAGAGPEPLILQTTPAPGSAPMGRTHRDIRVAEGAAPLAAFPAAERSADMAPPDIPAAMDLRTPMAAGTLQGGAPRGGDARTGAALRAPSLGERARAGAAAPGAPGPGPDPLELAYGPAAPGGEAAGEGAESGGAHPESEYVRKLPDWARRFLREGAQRTGQAMGSARSIATLPPQAGEETVHWQAPGYRPPAAPIAYREKREAPGQTPAPRISEAELQRTADRVYQMIEDRIRRERRRLGL